VSIDSTEWPGAGDGVTGPDGSYHFVLHYRCAMKDITLYVHGERFDGCDYDPQKGFPSVLIFGVRELYYSMVCGWL